MRSPRCPTPTDLHKKDATLAVENGHCGFVHQLCSEVDLPDVRRSVLTLDQLIQRHFLDLELDRLWLLRPEISCQFIFLLESEQIVDSFDFGCVEALHIGTISSEEAGDVGIVDDENMRHFEDHQQLC